MSYEETGAYDDLIALMNPLGMFFDDYPEFRSLERERCEYGITYAPLLASAVNQRGKVRIEPDAHFVCCRLFASPMTANLSACADYPFLVQLTDNSRARPFNNIPLEFSLFFNKQMSQGTDMEVQDLPYPLLLRGGTEITSLATNTQAVNLNLYLSLDGFRLILP